MAQILFGTHSFDADLILFDKDGTLLRFDHFWAYKTVEAVENLLRGIAESTNHAHGSIRQALYHTFGVEPSSYALNPHSPIVVAANTKLVIVVATVLHQHGIAWQEAELLSERYFAPILNEPPSPEMLQPIVALPSFFAQFQQAGIRIGIITSDNLYPTERTLEILGVREMIDFLACADNGYPPKPSPAAIMAACQELGVSKEKSVIVGDSTTDLVTGQRAEIGLRVGVLTGVFKQEVLAPLAHVILGSIEEIQVAK